jgi:hypothetical protein
MSSWFDEIEDFWSADDVDFDLSSRGRGSVMSEPNEAALRIWHNPSRMRPWTEDTPGMTGCSSIDSSHCQISNLGTDCMQLVAGVPAALMQSERSRFGQRALGPSRAHALLRHRAEVLADEVPGSIPRSLLSLFLLLAIALGI